MINGSSVKPYVIKSKLPWHVIGTVAFVIDSDSLKNRLDIGIDAWRWEVYKTQTSSTADISEEARYSVCDRLEEHRIVKRYYKCTDNHEFKRQILAIYPPGHQCKSRKNPYEFCRGNILISYISPSETSVIKPCSKVRTYKSVLDQVKRNMQTGKGPTRASFEVEKKFGGLENIPNQSLVPRRSKAFEENRKMKKKQPEDPLKQLLIKQREEGRTGHPIIKRILFDTNSYTITLMTDLAVENIANFCCTENTKYKTSLNFDFTFELLKEPPFYALVSTYKNTSLYVKNTQRCPTLLGPVLLCHKRNEEIVQSFLDALTEKCQGLRSYLQVIGCDGEKSLINAGCATFPAAVMLLCSNHAKQNIKEKLKDLVGDIELRKTVYTSIFGNEFTVGLVYSDSFKEFDLRLEHLCKKWEVNPKLQSFCQYFQVHKADQFRYHIIKCVVQHTGIVDTIDLFTTNATECINSLLKSWEKKKQDPYNFAVSYENIIENQESNILRAFVGLESTFKVREEFKNYSMDFNDYAAKSMSEKQELRKKVANIVVDRKRYNEVLKFQTGKSAIKKMRENIEHGLSGNKEGQSLPDYVRTYSEGTRRFQIKNLCDKPTELKNQFYSIEQEVPRMMIDAIHQIRPDYSIESIKGTVTKALRLAAQNEIQKGFSTEKRFVKSTSGEMPHVVTVSQNGSIKCDKSCKHFKEEQYCAHVLSVAISEDLLQPYIKYLSQSKEMSLNDVASLNVKRNEVGRKKAIRSRAPIIPKMQSSSYQRNTYCELDTKNAFPTLNMLPLHQATNTMYANIPVATPEAIQPPYSMLYRSIQNPITLQQQSNIDMRFNSYISQERNHNVQGYVFLGAHSTINENQFVLSSLSSCDARVSSCYGCDRPLKIIMADGSKRIPDPPFDLVLITKMRREYRKDGEIRKSSEFRNVYFHAQMTGAVRFACVRQKVNLNEKSIQIDSRMLPILNAVHVGFLTFTLKLDHLVNSIQKVN